jgi:hypothetical protein
LFSCAEVGQSPMEPLFSEAEPVVNAKAATVELPDIGQRGHCLESVNYFV